METVLAGADGKSPAVDAATGAPLTIEELLRRRGLLATGGNSRMMPFAAAENANAPTSVATPVFSTGAADDPVAAALAARVGATPATATTNTVPPVGPVPSDPNNPSNPVAGMAMPNIDPSGLAPIAVGAATGLGYSLARRKKQGVSNNGINSSAFGVDNTHVPKPGEIANGNTNKNLTGVMQDRGASAGRGRQKRLTGPINDIPYGEYMDVNHIAQQGQVPDTLTDAMMQRASAGANVPAVAGRDVANTSGRPATRVAGQIAGTRQLPSAIPEADYTEVLPALRKALTNRNTSRALTRIIR